MTIYDYVWFCLTMYANVRLSMIMYDYVWLFMTMLDYVCLCRLYMTMTMYDYVWLYLTLFEYVWKWKSCMIMYDYLWLCWTMYANVWLCMTMYNRERERWWRPIIFRRTTSLCVTSYDKARLIAPIDFWQNFTYFFCLAALCMTKNDDSVKEAPAYCRSFLDGLNKLKGRPKTPYFNVLKCFVMICNVL